ncbi:similar to doublesex and mab-3 related transcription factor 6 (predicted) [Rattus norvegicus]|uniref:Similar to doublesex and mab-3 related transcription factor 6 (Predicted) n=1 Tax=Rattus norvegicus TaxID=10116 RepID=A6JYS4_RAT|nr:similar to doublesex and mab-3 related transcription factor 6 (predicted) [Rattus norvegicus]
MLRTPKCSRCRNHGYLVPVKGHAGKCRWKHCICDKCYLITERQKIMAAQKVLKNQATEEQGATVGTQGPQLPPRAPAPAAATATASSSSICPLPRAALGGAGPGPAATCFLERSPQARSPGPSAFQLELGTLRESRSSSALPASLCHPTSPSHFRKARIHPLLWGSLNKEAFGTSPAAPIMEIAWCQNQPETCSQPTAHPLPLHYHLPHPSHSSPTSSHQATSLLSTSCHRHHRHHLHRLSR